MKKFYFSKLIILVALLTGFNMGTSAQTVNYTYTGAVQYFTVGAGVTSVSIDMAGGGGGISNCTGVGGKGGRVVCQLAVTPGTVLNVYVAGQGANYVCCGINAGGFNGGGTGYEYGGGGGGGSDIRVPPYALANRLVVASGGGGAGYNWCNEVGGAGGGLSGTIGVSYSGAPSSYSGQPGTQVCCAAAATYCCGCNNPGALGAGGNVTCGFGGGGGGGGYFGGGSGDYYCPGGGGSAYITDPTVSGAVTTPGFQAGNGYVNITGPTLTVYPSTRSFGCVAVGTLSVPQSIKVSGVNLSTTPCTMSCPSGYQISLDGSTWTTGSLNIAFTPPTLPITNVYIQFAPTVAVSYCSFTVNFASGPTTATVPVCGNGAASTCSGTPTAGTAVITPTTGNSGTAFALNVTGSSCSSDLAYQWQSSSTGLGGWTNILGAITYQYNFIGITATTYYRCVITCPSTGGTANSSVVSATFKGTLTTFAKPCSGTPLVGFTYAPLAVGCSPYSANIFNVGAAVDSGITYQWQSSPDGLSWSNVPGTNAHSITQSISGTVYYRDIITCNIGTPASVTTGSVQLILNTPPNPIAGIQNICTALPVTMTETTTGGTWSTSNPAVAGVGSTGIVTGTGTGTATVSYTLATGCNATIPITVNASPAAVTGPVSVCTSQSIPLTDATAGGVWSSSSSANATVGSTGTTTGVTAATTPNISYTLPSGCSSYLTVSVNQLPAPITGTTNVCVGSNTLLGDIQTGGTWISSNSFKASIDPLTGLVTGIGSGVPITISYTLAGGCTVTTPVTVNPLPGSITGPLGFSNVCVGSTVTLSDAGGGTWGSQYPSVATISGAGMVTGVASGTTTITYTLPGTGCKTTAVEAIQGLPAVYSVTGGGGYCAGSGGAHVGLSGSTIGIDYNLYNSGSGYLLTMAGSSSGLDFGLMTATGTYSVVASNHTYGCSSNMLGNPSITINPPPNTYTLSVVGSGSYCAGGLGVDLNLSGSDVGVNYQIMNGAVPVGLPVPGTGVGVLDLHYRTVTVPTSFTVVATNASTLCTANMLGTANVSVNPLPAVYTLKSFAPSYCVSGPGVDITLSGSAIGINYTLLKGGIFVSMLSGTGSALDFLTQPAGCYTCVASDATTGCASNMLGTVCVTTNPLPLVEPVTGGGNYCAGGLGVHVGLSYSVIGTNYKLMPGGITLPGSNSGLDFGLQTTTGSYSVLATNGFGCSITLTGPSVNATPLPNNTFVLGGGGPYCAGTTGSDITLSGSESGILYKLYDGLTLVNTMTGTGSPLDLGLHTAAGTYSAIALNTTSGCTASFATSVSISVIPMLNLYTLSVSRGGHLCTGDITGADITLSGSQVGVNYDLYVTGVGFLTTMAGTGFPLVYTGQTAGGIYSVVATNPTTTCTRNMTSTALITIDPLPAVYSVTVTGGGNYCAGGAGQHIGLNLSNTGINYQLQMGVTNIGTPLGGTGAAIDFGLQKTMGSYTVLATNAVTGCQNGMAGSYSINIISLPTPYTLTSAGSYCAGAPGSDVQLSGSVPGVDYKLLRGSSIVSTIHGSGSALDFMLQPAGTYSAIAIDVTYGCTSNMTANPIIGINPLPTAYKVTGTGNFCFGGLGLPVGLSNSNIGVSYQLFNTAGLIPGSNPTGTGHALNYGLESLPDTYTVVATDNATGCTNNMTGNAVIGISSPVTPTISISTSTDTVCAGSSAKFTSSITNGGSIPAYNWMVNGVSMGTSNTFTYTPTLGDSVTAMLTSNATCVLPANVTSSAVYMGVNPGVTPSVAISTPNTVVCAGTTPVTFTATPVHPGTAPVYQWKLNGNIAGTNSSTFSTVVKDKDVVFAVLASNEACNLVPFVLSTPITMTVNTTPTPDFYISALPGTSVQKGQPVTFTAWVSNTTGTFKYQWSVNGAAVTGATNGTYVTTTLATNDMVSCTVSSVSSCGIVTGSHDLFMTVGTTGITQVNITGDVRVIPNPNKGTFTVKGSLGTTDDQEVTMEITNMLGQVVYNNKVMAQGGNINQQIQLSNTLANGMYILNLRSGVDTKSFHFVIEQ